MFIHCLLSFCPCSRQKMALPLACVSLTFLVMAVALVRWFQRCASALVLATLSLHPPTLTSERTGPVSCSPVHPARCRFMLVSRNPRIKQEQLWRDLNIQMPLQRQAKSFRYIYNGAKCLHPTLLSHETSSCAQSVLLRNAVSGRNTIQYWQHFLPPVPWEWSWKNKRYGRSDVPAAAVKQPVSSILLLQCSQRHPVSTLLDSH